MFKALYFCKNNKLHLIAIYPPTELGDEAYDKAIDELPETCSLTVSKFYEHLEDIPMEIEL